MKWILLISGFVILFSVCILYVVGLKKLYKEEQDDFENATHLNEKIYKINMITKENISEFSDAVVFGDFEKVKQMAKDNSEIINYQDQYGFSALHNVMSEEQFEIVDFLIKNDANVNIQNDQGISPLHLAGYPENAELLLNAGAEINIIDYQGNTPLHIIASDTDESIDVIEYLISRNANKNLKNKLGKTPLENAVIAGNEEIVDALRMNK